VFLLRRVYIYFHCVQAIDIYFLVAVFCGTPPTILNADVIGLATNNVYAYDSLIIYVCINGRKFDDGKTVEQINCVGTGYWTELTYTCQCKNTNYTLCDISDMINYRVTYNGFGIELNLKDQLDRRSFNQSYIYY